MIDPFTQDQIELIRKGKITGALISGSLRPPRLESLRPMRRIVRVLDGDGTDTGLTTIETTSSKLTIRTVSKRLGLDALTGEHARLCGCSSTDELRARWLSRHPRTELVRVVEFRFGDVRDHQPLLQFGAGHTLNPARSPDPTGPVVPFEYQEKLTEAAHLRDIKRKSKRFEVQSLADRVGDLERRAREGDMEAQKHLFVIRQRVERGEQRRAA